MRIKIFHPEHEEIEPIFIRKPNPNQKKKFKLQTKTQPQTETKFSKTKSKPQSKPNRKENKLRRNRIERKTNFIVTHDVLCYNDYS